MKTLFTLTFVCLMTFGSFGQPKYDRLKTNQIFLKVNNKFVEVYTINKNNIQRLLGSL